MIIVHFFRFFPFFLHIFICFPTTISTQRDLMFSCMEKSGNYTKNSLYQTNLNTLLSSLASGIDKYGFNSSSFGNNPNTVNAISLCEGDVDINSCHDCIRDASTKITEKCPESKEAIAYYDKCMLRYSNKSIHGKYQSEPGFDMWNLSNVTSIHQFSEVLQILLSGTRSDASNGDDRKKFSTNSTVGPDALTIYALMQCTPDLSKQDCDNCLSDSANVMTDKYRGTKGCTITNPSCKTRYEVYKFFNDTTSDTPAPPPPPANGPNEKEGSAAQTTIIIITSISGFAMVLLIFGICILMKKKRHMRLRQRADTMHEYSSIDDMRDPDSLQFDFGIISDATDNFSQVNKLGEGGFGAVYKGRLENGQEIAVKRLSQNSCQGEHEFKNEIKLVAKLQHRNLVRLLGFSFQGTERLLIYEFVTNSSLDRFIFDPIKSVSLNWNRRFKIISGIAKGLLYLHEDSRLRIIHRDLKASNVLLDNEMEPKIADFGLARLFVRDETQGSTSRIAGTYGYMAPEYAMHGHFSVKSDVFSFGVLVLEILTGKKNSYSNSDDSVEYLLSNAWKSWSEGTAASLIDPALSSSTGSTREMMRCFHIGLLCVQENLVVRPTMAPIVIMLSSSSITLPMPSRPAFFLEGSFSGVMDIKSIEWRSTSTVPSQNEASITELYPR